MAHPDAATRAQFVRTLLQIASSREEEPLLLRTVRAFVDEVAANHPEWLIASPDLSVERRHVEVRREVWERMRVDPAARPANMVAQAPFLRGAIAESVRRQRERRRARNAGILLPPAVINADVAARLQQLIDALPEPEAWWRIGAGASWWHALVERDRLVGDVGDYLRPYLAVDRLNVEPWMRFWIAEANATRLAVIRAHGVADFFQIEHEVESRSGNWGDINHAGFAVGRDFLVTADRAFADVLTKVRQQPAITIATPVLVQRGGPDIVAEIRARLGW